MKYSTLNRIKQAIEHLEQFRSNWLLPGLVFATNGVNCSNSTNLNEKNGTDRFLDNHFNGSLIGLPAFKNGANSLRPRFQELKSTLVSEGKAQDYVLHQKTRLWANAYSSRGYREMLGRGLKGVGTSSFQFTPRFKKEFEGAVPSTFRFEELLVWLYAFNGMPDDITSWEELESAYKETYLGPQGQFDDVVTGRFKVNSDIAWPNEMLSERPDNSVFQKELLPSSYSVPVTSDDLAALFQAIKERVADEYQGLEDTEVDELAANTVAALASSRRVFVLGDPGVGKTTFADLILNCLNQVFGEERVLSIIEPVTDRTTPESLMGYVSIGGDWVYGSLTSKRPDGRGLLYTSEELTNPAYRNQINVILLDEANRRDVEALLARLQISTDATSIEPRDRDHEIRLGKDGPFFMSPFTYWIMTGNSPRDDEGRVTQSRPFRRRPNLVLLPNVFEKVLSTDDAEFHTELVRFWEKHCKPGLRLAPAQNDEVSSALKDGVAVAADLRALLGTLAEFKVGVSFGLLEKLLRTAAVTLSLRPALLAAFDGALSTAVSPLLSTERRVDSKSIKTLLCSRHEDLVPRYPRFFGIVKDVLEEDPVFHITEPFF
jgi:hypothetical protein